MAKEVTYLIDKDALLDAMNETQIFSEEGRRWQRYFMRMVEDFKVKEISIKPPEVSVCPVYNDSYTFTVNKPIEVESYTFTINDPIDADTLRAMFGD